MFVTPNGPAVGGISLVWVAPTCATDICPTCSVDDLRSKVENVVANPSTMAYVTRTHDASVQSVYETADTTVRKKRKRVVVTDPDQEQPEVTSLCEKLEAVQLKSWP